VTLPRGHASAAFVCLLLAAAHTWPLITEPASLSLNSHADALLNEWILAWIAHQIPRDPLQLFEANIFHPARHALAFSEPLIAPALAGAPFAWMGASPVLIYNVLLIGGLALSALAAYALVFSWTRDRAAGLVAGSGFAFNTHTLARLAHIQAIHLYGLPLAILAIDRLIARPRPRAAIGLAACMTLLGYTSGYSIVFAAIAVAVALAARAAEWRAHARAFIAQLAIAAALTGAAIAPVYLPYRAAAREYGMARTLENVAQFSATPSGYLASAARVHAGWSARFVTDPGVNAFFAGFAVIALAIAALVWSRHARARVAMLVALAAAGVLLSLGTATPIYGWLYAVFPPMQGLRVASRFANLYLLAMALLAGIGFAVIRRRLPDQWALAAAVAAVAAVNIEAAVAPIRYERFGGIPRIYALLGAEPDPVVLVEVPVPPAAAIFENAPYVFASTAHWKKLVNGYSGYIPPDYRRLQPSLWHFPHATAIQAMRDVGVTHVMIHPARMFPGGNEVVEQAERTPDLERVAIGPHGMRLYRLRR
jgi:hypothetical protein